jgi:catechol 2,3-dioxygenase-like lactoylglutathione lyase family enzyme
MKPGLHHVDIITTDLRKSLSFYRDILGMQLAGWYFREELFEFLFLRDAPAASHFCLEFCGPPLLDWQQTMLEAQGPALDHLSMLAPDIDNWYRRLRQREIPFLQSPEPVLGAREMYFRDPSGAILEILTPDDPGLTPTQLPAPAPARDQPALILHHVSLLTSDPEPLAAFYEGTFGFTPAPPPPGVHAAGVFLADTSELHSTSAVRPMLRIARTEELGAPKAEGPNAPAGGLYQIGFQTEDLDGVLRSLLREGVDAQLAPEPGGLDRVGLTDPEGIEIAIFHSDKLPH